MSHAHPHGQHDHDHGHDLGHDHHHDQPHTHEHAHTPRSFGRVFGISAALNVAVVLLQGGYGLAIGSMALLTDAAHNFGDVLGLLLAWLAYALARRSPSGRYTYGYRSGTILAVLANSIVLLIATGAIAWEAVLRIGQPVSVPGNVMMAVAVVGIVANGASAWLLMSGQQSDMNIRGAFLHMVADAAVSAGVVVAGAGIVLTGWSLIDPIVSLVIAAVIVWSTWSLMRDSLALSLNAVPRQIDLERVRDYLRALPNVKEVHDLHIWAMSTTDTALTCHLVMPDGHPGDAFFIEVAHHLRERFKIGHPTIQIEVADAEGCRQAENCCA